MADAIRVTVWGEYRHEKSHEAVRKVYPKGMHTVIAKGLNACEGIKAKTATLDEPEHGLTAAVLKKTDVLTWWGHMAHHDVKDEIVERVQQRVLDGMGLIVPALRPLLEDLPQAHGHHVQPAGGASTRRRTRAFGSPRRTIPSRTACRSTSSCRTRRCTASSSTSPRRTNWSS